RRPGAEFHLSKGERLPFPDGAFDLVLCTGVLNHNPDYLDMIGDLLRVARTYTVIDLPRLVTAPYRFDLGHSHMVLDQRFGNPGAQHMNGRVPYVLANVSEVFAGIAGRFGKDLSALACRGYYGKTSGAVTIPFPEVIFAVTLLAKGAGPAGYA